MSCPHQAAYSMQIQGSWNSRPRAETELANVLYAGPGEARSPVRQRGEREVDLRSGLTRLVLFSAMIAAMALYHPGSALATEPKGYISTELAVGRFSESDVVNAFPCGLKTEENGQLWLSLPEAKGPSEVHVQSNVWAPGGSTGWHSHPGHSLIIVTAGTVTNYEGHDPDCKPHVYKTGMAFADPGGARVHILRNEGAVEAKTIAVQFIPQHAARRIEVSDPGNCHF
jgi:quercetin dioxygenase-like cupin family protein